MENQMEVSIFYSDDRCNTTIEDDHDVSIYFSWLEQLGFAISVAEIDGDGNLLDEPWVSIHDDEEDLFYGTLKQFHTWLRKNKEINGD
jgi:hypothetical protein